MRDKKCRKLRAVTRWFAVLEISLHLLCNTLSLIEGRTVRDVRSDSNANAASVVLKNMDPNVDPCNDFYRYACGRFINETIIPDSESSVDNFAIAEKKMRERLKLRLQAEIEPNEPRHFKLVKNFYKICMNTPAIEARGFEFLRAQLNELGGWPVLLGDAWNKDEFVWTRAIYKLRDTGHFFTNLINFVVGVDSKSSTKRVIYIDQAVLALDRRYLEKGFDDERIIAYYDYMVDMAVMLGANRHRALTELKESLIFEMQLANISLAEEERRDPAKLYNPMTLTELSTRYPGIPWGEYFSRLLPSSITVKDDEFVIVKVPSYIANLEKLLRETPKKILANYLMWRAAEASLPYLHDDVLKRQQKFLTVFTGNTERAARSDKCTHTVSLRFPIIIGAMYVKQYFNEEARQNASAMVKDIRRQFNDMLNYIDWMSERTRVKALYKASAMVSHIGYPNELLHNEKVEKLYKNFDVSGDNYLKNILNLKKFETDSVLGKLREPVNKTDWVDYGDAAVVNAFYSPVQNSIQFPAGILQGAFFDNDRPNYMNYGAIGFFIGHEITHGFDDQGKKYDQDGKLYNWWDAPTEDNFRRRARCIIEQYGNYTVPEVGLNLNGVNTQGENIADNGGIKIAYLAYKSWVNRNKAEKKLPGIDRTPEQMFWLSAANVWCSKIKPEALRSGVMSDEHSPNEFRILGAFSNMPEFATDYKCPKGSRMNPEKKCTIW